MQQHNIVKKERIFGRDTYKNTEASDPSERNGYGGAGESEFT